jgi:putative MATE family efflux protein
MTFGVLYGLTMALFSGSLISVYNIKEVHVASAAAGYLRIIGLGIPAQYMSAAITGAFNGSGSSRVPFYANAAGLFTNIILDPLMIFVLGWGIRGAAAATIIAQWVVFTILFFSIKRHKDRPFESFSFIIKPSRVKLVQIMRWAMPISIESALFTLLTMAVTRLIAGYGADALAVSRVSTQIESLSWLVGGGFGSAVTAFMGQNYGAGKWDRIRSGFRISTLTMLVWGAVVTSILYLCGHALTGFFLHELPLREMGAHYLRVLALAQITACLEGVGMGFFRGTGRTLLPSSISAVSNIFRVPLSYWLATAFLGLPGAWWGIAISAGLRGATVYGWALVALLRRKTATP